MSFLKRFLIVLLAATVPACANRDYRVERMNDAQSVQLPLKFVSMIGTRDGELVTASPVFKDSMDAMRLDLRVRLGPPITFVSGNFHATIGDHAFEGPVVCDSLSFL